MVTSSMSTCADAGDVAVLLAHTPLDRAPLDANRSRWILVRVRPMITIEDALFWRDNGADIQQRVRANFRYSLPLSEAIHGLVFGALHIRNSEGVYVCNGVPGLLDLVSLDEEHQCYSCGKYSVLRPRLMDSTYDMLCERCENEN